jgi:type IV secretory pathway TraG/TraD family ATPase VirD4
MSKNTQNRDNGVDLVSPLVDITHEVFKILIDLSSILLGIGINAIKRKYFGIYNLVPLTQKHLKSKKNTTEPRSLGYSVNNKRDYPLSEINFSKHTGIIGSTGSGKSVSLQLLIDHSLRNKKPVIYFDPKANLDSVHTFKKMCEAQGKKLYLFTDIVDTPTSFNPLLDGCLDDISDRIINALDWSEPFYKNESIQALDGVLECLKRSYTPITFKNIVHELEKHTNKKNIKGLINQLSKVSKSSYGELLNNESNDTLTFNKLRVENACIYIGISSMGHSSSGHILNKVFFGGLLTHAKDSLTGNVPDLNNPEEQPISVVFDELSSTIHEGFIDLQNKCRQAGIEISYATQGPSDIDRISPTLTAQIFENTNNLFVFNQIVPAHTEFFARTFGTVQKEKKTHVIEDNQRQSMGTVREVEEFLVHGNILRNLRVGQCVLFQRIPKKVDLINVRFFQVENRRVNTSTPKQASAVFNIG